RIAVRREASGWVITHASGPAADLEGVPFVEGVSEMLDYAARNIPDAGGGVRLLVSDHDFFGADIVLRRGDVGGDGRVGYTWEVGAARLTGRFLVERLAKALTRGEASAGPFTPPRRLFIQALPASP